MSVVPLAEPLPQPPPPPPPPARHRSNAKWWIIGLLACVLPAAALVGLGAFAVVTAKNSPQTPPSEEDRGLVVTAEEIAALVPDLEVDRKHEKFRRSRDFFGSVEFTYEYEPPEGGLYINCTASIERAASDAVTSLGAARLGFRGYLGAATEVKEERRDELFKWGDNSEFSILTKNGKAFGNFFAARKGNKVFMLMLAGVYVEDADILRDLLTPRLEALEKYAPKAKKKD